MRMSDDEWHRAIGQILARISALIPTALQRDATATYAHRMEHLVRRADEMMLPESDDLRDMVLDDDAPETDALRACREVMQWRDGHRRGCIRVLIGPTGVGKTTAACHAMLRSPATGLYVTAIAVGAAPRNGHSEREDLWERWLRPAVLVLDDLGAESSDPGGIVELMMLRYDQGRCTLVTSNLTRTRIAERYLVGAQGQRLRDRIGHTQAAVVGDDSTERSGLAWCSVITGPSLRDASARDALRAGRR
jgi:hypothetical protein